MEAAPKIAEQPPKAPARPPLGMPPGSTGAPTAASSHGRSPSGRRTPKEAAGGAPRTHRASDAHAAEDHAGGLSPKEKARLAAVEHRAAQHKASTTTHQTAEEATADAHAAAKEPKAQADGEALGDHAKVLEDNPPPDPLIVFKVLRIKWAIRAKRPVDEDDLGKAKPKDMAEEAGKEVSGDVKGAAQGVQTGYGPVNVKPPGTPSKTVTQMPPDAAAPPAADIHAAGAVPDP